MSEHVFGETTRYVDSKGFSDLSVAVDDIYDLRALCAHAVEVVDDMLALKSLAAYRQSALAEIRQALIAGARGDVIPLLGDRKRALREVGADDCLTNSQWAAQRNLTTQPAPHLSADRRRPLCDDHVESSRKGSA